MHNDLNKWCLKERNKVELRFRIKHLLAWQCWTCVPWILSLWAVVQISQLRAALWVSSKQVLCTHSIVFTYEAHFCVCPVLKPPTQTLPSCVTYDCWLVKHCDLAASMPVLFILCFSDESLVNPCFHCVMFKFWGFVFLKGQLYYAHYFWPDTSCSRPSTLLELGILTS